MRLLLASAALIAAAAPALAQKPPPPWEIGEVKISAKAPSPAGSEVTEFGGDGKERDAFLHVTLKFQKNVTLQSVRSMQVVDKKKKAAGVLFNAVADPDDKKSVTLVFKNPAMPWTTLDDLTLKGSSHSAPLKK